MACSRVTFTFTYLYYNPLWAIRVVKAQVRNNVPKICSISRIRHRQWDIDPDDGDAAVIETVLNNCMFTRLVA